MVQLLTKTKVSTKTALLVGTGLLALGSLAYAVLPSVLPDTTIPKINEYDATKCISNEGSVAHDYQYCCLNYYEHIPWNQSTPDSLICLGKATSTAQTNYEKTKFGTCLDIYKVNGVCTPIKPGVNRNNSSVVLTKNTIEYTPGQEIYGISFNGVLKNDDGIGLGSRKIALYVAVDSTDTTKAKYLYTTYSEMVSYAGSGGWQLPIDKSFVDPLVKDASGNYKNTKLYFYIKSDKILFAPLLLNVTIKPTTTTSYPSNLATEKPAYEGPFRGSVGSDMVDPALGYMVKLSDSYKCNSGLAQYPDFRGEVKCMITDGVTYKGINKVLATVTTQPGLPDFWAYIKPNDPTYAGGTFIPSAEAYISAENGGLSSAFYVASAGPKLNIASADSDYMRIPFAKLTNIPVKDAVKGYDYSPLTYKEICPTSSAPKYTVFYKLDGVLLNQKTTISLTPTTATGCNKYDPVARMTKNMCNLSCGVQKDAMGRTFGGTYYFATVTTQ